MGDFYVDDQFYDHPKALAAGEDAANLYVRGLAWAHRHNTCLIPKNALATLTTKKNPAALAKKLTEIAAGFDNPLWHDEGQSYRIHDWEVRNAKSIAKREQSKAAAHARWSRQSERNASASVSHSERSADAMPNQPRNQGTKEPGFALASSEHSRRLHVVPDDDETEEPVENRAMRILAELALERREKRLGPVEDKTAWLLKTAARRAERYADDIRDALGAFTWKPEDLARHLEPGAFSQPPTRPEDYVPKCQTCNDRPAAYDIDEHGNAIPCPACNPSEETA